MTVTIMPRSTIRRISPGSLCDNLDGLVDRKLQATRRRFSKYERDDSSNARRCHAGAAHASYTDF